MVEFTVLAARDHRVSADKHAKYRGSAQVYLEHLDFPHPCRHVDISVIEQLSRNFEGEGCMRDTNRIPAIIDDVILFAALSKLGINNEAFKAISNSAPPLFQLERDVKVECLHGQHRILAAKKFLKPKDRWWIVDFYSNGQYLETHARGHPAKSRKT